MSNARGVVGILLMMIARTASAYPPYDPTGQSSTCAGGNQFVDCVGPNNCDGVRACQVGGASPICKCVTESCIHPVCGTLGIRPVGSHGACTAPESCNGCDDNNDGNLDEIYGCAAQSLESVACDPAPITTWSWSTAIDVYPGRSGAGGVWSRGTLFKNNLIVSGRAAGVSADFLKNASVADGMVVISGNGPATTIPFNPMTATTVSTLNGSWPERLTWLFGADGSEVPASALLTAKTPRVSCGAPVSRVTSIDRIETGERFFALLTAPGDTVFFSFQTNNDQTAIWLSNASPGLDADLYVRVDSLPDKTSTCSARPNTSNEFIDAAYASHTVFIAVTARAGRGVVELHAASRRAVARFNLEACTDINWSPTPTDLAAIDTVLRRGQEHFWGMTEGKVAVESITLRIGDCYACDICFHKFPDRAYAPGWVNLYANHLRTDVTDGEGPLIGARTLAHEWGHALLGLDDEYADCDCHRGDDRCRESAMDDQRFSLNLCNAATHGRSVDLNGHVCSTSCGYDMSCTGCNTCSAAAGVFPPNDRASAWEYIGTHTSLADPGRIPTFTPDPTPYGSYVFPIFTIQ